MATQMKWVVGADGVGVAVPYTAAEIAQYTADQTVFAAAAQAALATAATRTQAIATIKAKAATDPAFAALITILGL